MQYKQRASGAGLIYPKSGKLGLTGKKHIALAEVRDTFGVQKPDNDFAQTLKGNLCEDEAIELLDSIHPVNDFRVKNKTRYYSELFTGEPDTILFNELTIEDTKCSYDFVNFRTECTTFEQLKKDHWLYYIQLLTYRELLKQNGYEMKKMAVCYSAINTPLEVLERFEFRKLSSQFGYDTDEYHKAVEQVIDLHTFDDKLTPQQRVKRIEWEFDDQCQEDTENLIKQMIPAREYYNSLKPPNQ